MGLKVYLENELNFGRDIYPKTLTDAHRITQNSKVTTTSPGVMPFMPTESQSLGEDNVEEPMYVMMPNPKFKAGSIAGDIPKHSSLTWSDGGGAGKEQAKQTLTIPSYLKGKQVRTLDESDKRHCLETDCKAESHLVKDCVIRKWKNDKREKLGKDTAFVGCCSYMATLEECQSCPTQLSSRTRLGMREESPS